MKESWCIPTGRDRAEKNGLWREVRCSGAERGSIACRVLSWTCHKPNSERFPLSCLGCVGLRRILTDFGVETLKDLMDDRWHATGNAAINERGEIVLEIECACGNVVIWDLRQIRRNVACNLCRHHESNYRHGDAGERLHGVWIGMRQRCSNPNATSYADYGGRGITVCSEWEDYPTFRKWALNAGYTEGLTLHRSDNDGDYNPENCRWETQAVQSRHTRRQKRRGLPAGVFAEDASFRVSFGTTVKGLRSLAQAEDVLRRLRALIESFKTKLKEETA